MEASEEALMVARELAEEYLGAEWDYPMPWQGDWVERRNAARLGRQAVPGLIYVMRSPFVLGLIKIGRTKHDVDQRRRTFATAVPGIEAVAAWQSDDAAADEAALHRIFADNRVPGTEWFSVDVADVEQAWASLRAGTNHRY